jgi:cysteine-rich repeat protein
VVQLIVNDGHVDSDVDTVTVTVPCGNGAVDAGEQCDDGNTAAGDGCSASCQSEDPPNRPPVAYAGRARVVAVGETVVIDGTGSADPEGQGLSYHWSLGTKPAGSTSGFADPTAPVASFQPDVAGQYVIHLVVDDGLDASAPARVIVTALTGGAGVGLSVTSPAEGESLPGDRVRVEGLVQGPANLGVVVNGVVAIVEGGAFVADDVPLASGVNTLTATGSVLAGQAATASITVTSAGSPPVAVLTASPRRGFAPLTTRFTYGLGQDFVPVHVAIDYDGDGTFDGSTSDLTTALEYTYSSPGIYKAQLQLTDATGATASAAVAIGVSDVIALDATFKSVWDDMHAALVAGDLTSAIAYLDDSAVVRYEPIFELLLPHMQEIVASFSPLQGITTKGDFAEYAMTRVLSGEARVFLIDFVRDVDGVWRLSSM